MDMDQFTLESSSLFYKNKWCDYSLDGIPRLISIAEKLDNDERDVLYNLLLNYRVIPEALYIRLLRTCLGKLESDLSETIKKIYIMPLLAPKDNGRTDKSCFFVLRLFKSPELRTCNIFANREVFIDEKENLFKNSNNSDIIILLVDDFIGTGDTGIDCINDYMKKNILPQKMKIITVSSMQKGKDELQKKGVQVYEAEIAKRGITDYYKNELQKRYFEIIDKVEQKYEIREEYKRGYHQSEGIISLVKTPNNTFPIFWSRKFKTPPFERY